MSIHSLPEIPGVDVHELLSRDLSGQGSIEAQDNAPASWWDSPDEDDDPALAERAERQRAEAVYWKAMRSEKRALSRLTSNR